MKKIAILLLFFSFTRIFSQAPPMINYQGMMRDASGIPVGNIPSINVAFIISDATSNIVHNETVTAVPVSSLGLFSTQIGKITPISNSLNWQNSPYTLSVFVNAGSGFSPLGTQQLASVPFALYAKNAATPTLQINGNILSISGGNSITLPGSISSYTSGNGIIITGSVITNAAPDQTVTLADGTNVTVNGTYPTFTINAVPTLSVTGSQLSISGGNSVTLPTGTTYTNGVGISLISGTIITNTAPNQTVNIAGPGVLGSYPNYTVTGGAQTSITAGNSNINILGADPSFTISSSPTLVIAGNSLSISNGNTVIIPPPLAAWNLTGNAATNSSTNFIGTTDNTALNFRINNFRAGLLDPAGATYFGYRSGGSNTSVGTSAFGYQSLFSNTTAGNNSAFGHSALYSNLTGNLNTASGSSALYSNTSGTANTASGAFALYFNTAGSYNTATGQDAMRNNSNGLNNAAHGVQALYANTSGGYNTANGVAALYANTTGSYNVAIGNVAMQANTTGDRNVAIGNSALFGSSTGNNNTAVGGGAMQAANTGNSNVALGTYALFSNLSGSENAANGYASLYSNSTGSFNTSSGYSSGYNNTSGTYNSIFGYQSLYSNTNGSSNTSIGSYAFFLNTNGSQNTSIGSYAGYNNTGSRNVFLGYAAGYSAVGSDQLYIANSNTTTPLIYGDFNLGRVGIKTTTPSEILELGSFSSGQNNYLSIRTSGGNQYKAGIKLNHFNTTDGFTIESNEFINRLDIIRHAVGSATVMSFDRLNNRVGINTTSPTQALDVDGTILITGGNANELNRTQTGDANLAPIAYGNFAANGTIYGPSTTGNVSLASHTIGSGLYYVVISGEAIFYQNYVVAATLNGNAGEISWNSVGGQLIIQTFDSSGNPSDRSFNFVVYKK